jgi:hypothetical protein
VLEMDGQHCIARRVHGARWIHPGAIAKGAGGHHGLHERQADGQMCNVLPRLQPTASKEKAASPTPRPHSGRSEQLAEPILWRAATGRCRRPPIQVAAVAFSAQAVCGGQQRSFAADGKRRNLLPNDCLDPSTAGHRRAPGIQFGCRGPEILTASEHWRNAPITWHPR